MKVENTIEVRLKEDIVGILKEASCGVDDGFGGLFTGVFDDSFDEVAGDIVKIIESTYVINDQPKPLYAVDISKIPNTITIKEITESPELLEQYGTKIILKNDYPNYIVGADPYK